MISKLHGHPTTYCAIMASVVACDVYQIQCRYVNLQPEAFRCMAGAEVLMLLILVVAVGWGKWWWWWTEVLVGWRFEVCISTESSV